MQHGRRPVLAVESRDADATYPATVVAAQRRRPPRRTLVLWTPVAR